VDSVTGWVLGLSSSKLQQANAKVVREKGEKRRILILCDCVIRGSAGAKSLSIYGIVFCK